MRLGLTVGVAGGSPGADRESVRAAEAAGFDTVSVGEASLDTFAAATAVALWSTTPRVYSGVATWTRPPVLTATSAATVDRFAQGRYCLGLGTMPPAWNTDYYGIDPSHPLDRMREYVEVVRGSLRAHSGRTFDHDGRFFGVRGFSRMAPPLRDDLPVHLAATRPAMARLAGEIADGVLFNVLHTASMLRDILVPAVQAGGRTVERGVMVRCAIADTDDALAMVRQSLRLYLRVPYLYEIGRAAGFDLSGTRRLADAGSDDEALAAIPDELIGQMGLAGSPTDVAQQLQRYEGLVDWVLLAPPSGLSGEELAEQSLRIVAAFATVGTSA